YFSKNNSKLLMDLEDGEIHEADVSQTSLYRKIRFEQHRIAMEAEQFSFKQSTPGGQRSDRELSAQDMLIVVDSLSKIKSGMDSTFKKDANRILLGDTAAKPFNSQLAVRSLDSKYIQTIERIRESRNQILSAAMRSEFYQNEINMFMVEIHKKYSIPFACLVFILLGAPLGVMIRKGGFGIAASISLFFFLIYWASLIGGEKLADRGIISPFWGMWAANIIMGIVGMFLTYKVAKESVHIDFDFLKKLIPKNLRPSEEDANENS
ncbi:MAG: LptF/LptG family permease, partial [Ignavibacteriaceae bacterium]|nr:LptF/LptG family permease [Ignavibacteriaceae bacterium]